MVFPQAGSVIPGHSTSIGKILLAYMDEAARNEVIDSTDFGALTVNTITTPEKLINELVKVKEEGVAFDNQENLIGLSGVGGPIFNQKGVVIAGFAVTGDSEQISAKRKDIINAVKYTSSVISSQLGYSS
jgi:DNA-binding IclR family transcriptional regulator